MNKILIIMADQEEQAKLEEYLHEIVREGCELLIASTREQAVTILTRVEPHLIFFEEKLLDDEEHYFREKYGETLVVLRKGKALYSNDLGSPLQHKEIEEKCRAMLPLGQKSENTLLM